MSKTSEIKAWMYTTSGYPQCLPTSPTAQNVPSSPPTPHHVLIRTRAAALNPVDIQLMNLPLFSHLLQYLPRLPIIGSTLQGPKGIAEDFSGTVITAGQEAAKAFSAGDEVLGLTIGLATTAGCLAEVIDVDTRKATMIRKPQAFSFEQAAALPLTWLTARTSIAGCEPYIKSGGKLLVLGGSSATGMHTVHLAKQRGWQVMATCSGRNASFVQGMGADMVVDYTSENVPAKARQYRPDAVIDCVGGTECLNMAKRYVTIVGDKTNRAVMGGSATYLWQPKMLARWALGKLGYGVAYDCVNLEFNKSWLGEVVDLPADKIIIDSEFGFGQVKEAFERLDTGRARGKIVVKVSEG